MPRFLAGYAICIAMLICFASVQGGADERDVGQFDFNALPSDEKICDWLIQSSPTFRETHAAVLRFPDTRNIKFKSVDRHAKDFSEVGVFFIGGHCEIRLSNQLHGAERVRTLAFEIANASFHEEHRQIDMGAAQGFFTAREYAIAHEIYEYEAWRLYRRCLLEWEGELGEGRVPRGLFYGVSAKTVADYRLPPLAAHLKHMETSGHMNHYLDWFAKYHGSRPGTRRDP